MEVQTTQSFYTFTTETPELLFDGIACFQADASLTPRYLNPSLMDFLGLSVLPGSLAAYMEKEDLPAFKAFLNRLKPGETAHARQRLTDRSGTPTWVCASCQQVSKPEDAPALILCQFADLRYLKRTQTESYADQVPCGVFKAMVDDRLTLLYANAFFYETYGYTRETAEAAGFSNCELIVPPEDFKRVHSEITGHITAGQYSFELENRGRTIGGATLWVLVRCQYNPSDNTLFGAVFDITDRKTAEEALRISEEENRIALRHSDKFIARYDLRTHTLFQTEEAAQLLGQKTVTENVPDSVIQGLDIADETTADYLRFYRDMLAGQPEGHTSVRMFAPDQNRYVWYIADYSLVYSDGGEPITAIITYSDSTELHEREIAYERWFTAYEQRRKDSIAYYEFNLSADVLETFEGQTKDSIPEDCQQTLEALTHYTSEHFVLPEDRKKYRRFFGRGRLLELHRQGTSELSLEHRRLRPSGDGFFWARADVQMIDDPFVGAVRFFALIQDIDSSKRRSLELRKLSQTDPLTGLYNRATLIKRLGRVLRRGTAAHHALIILDIDHFKSLNDTCGHQFGDRVLIEVAGALRDCLRSNDFSGRLGGDEFMIFMRGLSDTAIIRDRLNVLRERLCHLGLTEAPLTVSIGVALFPSHGRSFQELYDKADSALYQAKRQGRDPMVFYE